MATFPQKLRTLNEILTNLFQIEEIQDIVIHENLFIT